MPSFGYQVGDGTGTNILIGLPAGPGTIFTPYENTTGDWLWVQTVDIFNFTTFPTGTFKLRLYYDIPDVPGVNPHEPGPVAADLSSMGSGSNIFTLAEEMPVPPGAIVWVGFHWESISINMRMDGVIKIDGGRDLAIGTGLPTTWYAAYDPFDRIIPATLSGTNTTDPTLTNLQVPSVLGESVVDGYSKLGIAVVIGESASGGYSKLKIPLVCLESVIPVPTEPYMSNEVFPELPGLSYNVRKKPTFNTRTAKGINGYEVRNAFMQFPIWEFELTYDYLPDRSLGETNLKTLMGFFLSRLGKWDTWLYRDPDDCIAQDVLVGTGDGVSTGFYFVKEIGSFREPIGQINLTESYAVYVDGVLQVEGVDYDVFMPNRMIFTVAPADGLEITNSMSYYYVCTFLEDEQTYDKFMDKLWELQSCSFKSEVTP